MSLARISALAGALSFASTVAAHGRVTGIVADGVYFQGFSQSFQYMQDPPAVAGWSDTYTDNGFVGPSEYTSSDIICHKGATPGKASATVAAGGSIDLQWTEWPVSHHGPVIDYLANCGGDCTTVDKEALKFFKIDGEGLVSYTSAPGQWASDDLIANNNTWTVKIPSDIAPGNYVLRHEIIALHSANNADGAQNYPQCFNLEVTGSGSATPAGIAATEFYTPTDPGILVNIYNKLESYVVPGPELFSDSGSSTPLPTSAAAPSPAAASSTPTTTPVPNQSSTAVAAPATTSAPAITPAVPAAPTGIIPPCANGTLPSFSSTTKKSSCKSKSRNPASATAAALSTVTEIATSTATVLPVPVEEPETPTAALTSTSASGPTAAPSAPSPPSPTAQPELPPQQPEEAASLPEGTRLSAVLKWISNFYAKNGDGEYVPNAAGATANKSTRRHARHLMF